MRRGCRKVGDLKSVVSNRFCQPEPKEKASKIVKPIKASTLQNCPCSLTSDVACSVPFLPPLKVQPSTERIAYDNQKTYKLLVFDLKTTGLKDAEICQIAVVGMKPNDLVWMKYILPDSRMDPEASQCTISVIDGKRGLLKNGIPVNAVFFEEALSDILTILKTQAATAFKTILIAHNAASFDVRILINSFRRCGVPADELEENGIGFADSLPLLRQLRDEGHPSLTVEGEVIKILALSRLYHDLFGEDFKCYEAVRDSLALCRVLSSLDVTLEQILAHSFTAASAWSRNDFLNNKNKLLQTMKGRLYSPCGRGVISKFMAEKIAKSGLGDDDLQKIYFIYGQKGIEQVFTSPRPLEPGQRKPKPRVTNRKDIIQAVVNYLKQSDSLWSYRGTFLLLMIIFVVIALSR